MLKRFLRLKLKTTPRTKRIIAWVALGIVIVLALSWRLTSLPEAFSAPEMTNFDLVRSNRVFSPMLAIGWPYFVILKAILRVTTNPGVIRGFSVIVSGLGLVMFYRLCREWWSRTVAISTTAILGTSYWFLLIARLADYQFINLALFNLLLLAFLRLKYESKWWQVALTGTIAGSAFYFPPVLSWLSLFLTILAIAHSISSNRGRLSVGWLVYFASLLVVLIPMIIAVSQQPSIIWSIFGLDKLAGTSDMLINLKVALRAMLWDGRMSPLLLPYVGLVDIAVAILALLGFIRTIATWKLQRSQFMLLTSLIVVIFIIASSQRPLVYGYALSAVYLFVARGFNQYLSEWAKRFPRNQSAKLASRLVLISIVSLIVVYNLQTYYTAWAKSDHVRAQFDQQLLK